MNNNQNSFNNYTASSRYPIHNCTGTRNHQTWTFVYCSPYKLASVCIIYCLYTYCHCVPCRLETMSRYWSRAKWRLTTLLGASNTEKTQLLSTELGFSVLTIWKDIFTDDTILSPPNFTHISFGGMTRSCQLSWFNLLILNIMCIQCMYDWIFTSPFPQLDEISLLVNRSHRLVKLAKSPDYLVVVEKKMA